MINSEFTAVILAATAGSRLYPLTISGDDEMDDYFDMNDDDDHVDDNNSKNNNNSDGLSSTKTEKKNPGNGSTDNESDSEITYLPKHLLPLAGRPIIHHLIDKLTSANLNDVVIVIAQEDEVTISSLMEMKGAKLQNNEKQQGKGFIQIMHIGNSCLKIVKLQSECNGSADALRFIMSTSIKTQQQKQDETDNNEHDEEPVIPHDNHVLVLPGDLVLYGNLTGTSEGDAGGDALRSLVDEHLRHYRLAVRGDGPPLALTLVLADVGETDENGAPLKESAKVRLTEHHK